MVKRVSRIKVLLGHGSIEAVLTFKLNELTPDEVVRMLDEVTDGTADALRNVPFEAHVPLRNVSVK